MDGIGLGHAGIGQCQLFEVVKTFDIGFDDFAASTGTSAGDGVAHLYDGGQKRGLFDFIVVGADGVADFRFLFVFLGEFHAKKCMRQLGFLVGHLAYVVKQTCAACLLGIEAELGGHDGAEVGGFARVLQEVLAVRRAVFHFAHHTDEVGVQPVDAEVYSCAFAGLNDFFFDLLAHFGHDFLDAGRVDASVGNELVEG